MQIQTYTPEDTPAILGIFRECSEHGDVLFKPLTDEDFQRVFVKTEGWDPELLLVAHEDEKVVGFIQGVAPSSFRGAKPGQGYVTCLMVSDAYRHRGIGRALLHALVERLKAKGATQVCISSLNPMQLTWVIPGTKGHDHNNSPGLDLECPGAGFFVQAGFVCRVREVAMYRALAGFALPANIRDMQRKLQEEGIFTGVYDPKMHAEYESLCDHVGSPYWKDVLRTETTAWERGEPNQDRRMWPDGRKPQGPRPILCAIHDSRFVGFTGPVDLQFSGRGWFTGICTDPLYEGRGIATVLFHLLMQSFVEEGARFTTLFTGEENHARKVYERTGLSVVRTFGLMVKEV